MGHVPLRGNLCHSTAMDSSGVNISGNLLAWYDRHARTLPWRAAPGEAAPEPYYVWLSEVMLQQTTTAAVAPYFARFLARWPTVLALAAAEDAAVMAAWAGLGYYARARNLLACARAVAALGGQFPQTEVELRRLPGVGTYTAAAVAAIAFGQRAVVVDANVERVAARLFALSEPLPAARKAIRALADQITPDQRSGDFAQAMMDLGATVCTPRKPRCSDCPLAAACLARAAGPERFPVRPAKRAKPLRQGRAYWIVQRGQVWLIQRPPRGMLGGMRALPDDGWSAQADGGAAAPVSGCVAGAAVESWRAGGLVRHSFTHFDLELQLMLYSGPDLASLPITPGEWWPLDRIAEAGLPTVFAKAARLALADN